ncbi:cupin domain-containing protein [Sphingomonas sp. SRS2]|uniref:cupin domain-containing protein n=1 Tax=Sphingomonas sp. SRS2 TaxID=133190 RepID=UPI0006184D35|nr:cupin domain-containing protein [Sphingomonas sp. SRS2]KKC23926.1 gentisate 1,2-dioxygenase [Sphingomonas sp. SRS2]
MSGGTVASQTQADREEFQADLAADNLQPLWDIVGRIAARAPSRGGVPIHWPWGGLRDHAMRAGNLITAEEAERRVLVLENPSFAGEGRATSSLYAGIQLILPGEIAPSHKHTASALRLIMEGEGAYTAVDGERVVMSPGDFVVTPSNTFHDHGNETDAPVMWLDGLDVFVVNLLNAPFGEEYPESAQPISRPDGYSLERFGRGMLPHGFVRSEARSPLFWWPYHHTRAALDGMRREEQADPSLGLRMDYIDPTSGQSPFKTMTASMSLFPAGYRGVPYRAISGAVMTVVEGAGTVRVGDETWHVTKNDVFVVPSWNWHSFTAEEDLVIFGFSDEVLQRHLGFWREERDAAAQIGIRA